MLAFVLPLLFVPAIFAAATPCRSHDHSEPRSLSGSWFHPPSHFARELFARGPDPTFPDVGSPEWSQGYPDDTPANIAKIPKAWKDALDKAVASGKIPSIPSTKVTPDGPVYPAGTDGTGPEVCSSTEKCRLPQDLWDAPEGIFASSFDDGPLPATSALIKFLDDQKVTTTHFMIGTNILLNVQQFQEILKSDNDLAGHTWTHPYMTSLSNEEVVGQLGWVMQLIYQSSKGKLIRYWRPPFGDSDARVSAIAREVFGLTTVLWNQDSNDWAIASGGATREEVDASLDQFLTVPKNPGLMVLEHEQTDVTVDAFVQHFPKIQQNGWKFASLASAYGEAQGAVQNSSNINVLFGGAAPSSSLASASASASSSSSSKAVSSTIQASTSSTQTSSSVSAASSATSTSNVNSVTTPNSSSLTRLSWLTCFLALALTVALQ